MSDINNPPKQNKQSDTPTKAQLEAIEQYQKQRQADETVANTPRYNGQILHWSSILMNTKNAFASNLANCCTAVEQDNELRGAFAFDEMLGVTVLTRPLFDADPSFKMRPITDGDVLDVQGYLQGWMKRLGRDTVRDAIISVAAKHRFHPIRLWLKGLVWDQIPRVENLFAEYFGAEINDYHAEISKMFLVSMVARVAKPGCESDYMVVLEGPQGAFKSRACKILGGEYFDDHMLDINTKDASVKLRGKWLIEWSEMRAYSRAETNMTKAFLTRTIEHYRPPYGRLEVAEPRQCIFIGSTNQFTYLTDETGGRRFWPVKIGNIKLEDLARDRDQLFAEAVYLYQDGVQWWPSPEFEEKHIVPEQVTRYDADVWEDPILDFLRNHETERVTLLQVATGALGYNLDTINRLGGAEQKRIKQCVVNAGWVPAKAHAGRRVWKKPQKGGREAPGGASG